MNTVPRIAIVQFAIAHLDSAKNLKRIRSFVRKAKSAQADVVVFPEDCMTGSVFGDLNRLDADQSACKAFQAFASEFSIDIVTGSCMEGTPSGNFNTSRYIDAHGNVLGTYRKNHLYPSERKFLAPGTEVPVFDTAFGRAGIVICWDMLFPEIFERMKKQGVQTIYCPSYWYREIADAIPSRDPRSEEKQIDALCLVRALETNAAVVYCNAAGTMTYQDGTKDTLIGHSQIVMPGVGVLKKTSGNREVMLVQEVNLSLLEASYKIYQV